jgi:hypothetical protein
MCYIVGTFASANLAISQVELEWARRYDGPPSPFGVDVALELAFDSTGNVFVTGGSEGPTLRLDVATLKYTPSGDQLWVSRFNEMPGVDWVGFSLAVDVSGNSYVAAHSVIKYNANGDTLWVKRAAGTVSGMRYINVDAMAHSIASGVRVNDYQTKKYDPNGEEQWARYLNGPANENDRTYGQQLDKQGNIIVTGRLANRLDTVNGRTDYIVGTAKYTPGGDTVWIRSYQGPSYYDAGYGLASDDSGNVYVTGESDDTTGLPELILIKYSPTGDTRWATRFRNTAIGDVGNEIVVDRDANVYVAGVTGSSSYMLAKFNAQGVAQWARVYAQYQFAIPLPKLALDTAGFIYVMGHQRRGSWSDYRIAKYDPNGNQLWRADYPQSGTGSNEPEDMKIDREGNIYVTGSGSNDYLTLKYRQTPTGIAHEPEQMPVAYALHQNYPNPFNPTTTISFDLPQASYVKLVVLDVLGREVATLVNEQKKAGKYEITFDAKNVAGSSLASGVYLYRVKAGNFSEVKKMVLLR